MYIHATKNNHARGEYTMGASCAANVHRGLLWPPPDDALLSLPCDDFCSVCGTLENQYGLHALQFIQAPSAIIPIYVHIYKGYVCLGSYKIYADSDRHWTNIRR